MTIPKLLRCQASDAAKVLEALLADSQGIEAHQRTFHQLAQLSICAEAIQHRRESKLMQHALKEYQYAQFALASGLYRQSFSSLRLALELALSTIDFSVNEVKLRRWLKGEADIVWATLVDNQNGVLSTAFVATFSAHLSEHASSYRAMAEKVYRECSEYVHGNVTTHDKLPDEILYSRECVLSWCDKADTVARVIIYAVAVRYMDDLDAQQVERLKPVWLDTLGHIEALRYVLGGSTGG